MAQQYLCATLRLLNNVAYGGDIQPLKKDFRCGMNEACVVYLSMKVESYIHQEINFDLVNKKP